MSGGWGCKMQVKFSFDILDLLSEYQQPLNLFAQSISDLINRQDAQTTLWLPPHSTPHTSPYFPSLSLSQLNKSSDVMGSVEQDDL